MLINWLWLMMCRNPASQGRGTSTTVRAEETDVWETRCSDDYGSSIWAATTCNRRKWLGSRWRWWWRWWLGWRLMMTFFTVFNIFVYFQVFKLLASISITVPLCRYCCILIGFTFSLIIIITINLQIEAGTWVPAELVLKTQMQAMSCLLRTCLSEQIVSISTDSISQEHDHRQHFVSLTDKFSHDHSECSSLPSTRRHPCYLK